MPDLVARAVADQLFIMHGQRAVVDNRPGAAGQISVGALKGAALDGLTLLLAQGAIATVYPALYAKLGYDPAVDLQPVSLASEMLLGLAVGPAVPGEVAALADFIAWMRHHPGLANIGSPAPGPCLTCWKPCCPAKKLSPGSTWRIPVARRRSPIYWVDRSRPLRSPKACFDAPCCRTRASACHLWLCAQRLRKHSSAELDCKSI
jgi:hypothetical protein